MLRSRLLTGRFRGQLARCSSGGCGGGPVTGEPPHGSTARRVPPGSRASGAESAGRPACEGAGKVMAISKLYLGDTNRDGTPNPRAAGRVRLRPRRQAPRPRRRRTSASRATAPRPRPCTRRQQGHRQLVRQEHPARSSLGLVGGRSARKSTRRSREGEFADHARHVDKLGTPAGLQRPRRRSSTAASKLGAAPKFDGTDMWPVIPELLSDPTDPASAKVQFPKSYVVKNTWVSGTKGDGQARPLDRGLHDLALTSPAPLISVDLDGGSQDGDERHDRRRPPDRGAHRRSSEGRRRRSTSALRAERATLQTS